MTKIKKLDDLLVELKIIEVNIKNAIQSYINYKYLKINNSSYSLFFLYVEREKIIASITSNINKINDIEISNYVHEQINFIDREVFNCIDKSRFLNQFEVNPTIFLKTWGGLGDCLLLTPGIRIIKRKYPSKKIKVYCENELHYQLLFNNRNIDEFIDSKTYDENQDVFFEANYSELLPSLFFKKRASEIIGFMLLQECKDDKLDLLLTDDEKDFGKLELANYKTPVCINPSSTCSKNQEWDLNNWKELVSINNNIDFIQIGKKDEQFIRGCKDYRGISLRECIAILGASKAFIGVDSFWNHAAHALGIKSIILFGDSSPTIWGHENNVILYKNYKCSPCIDILFGRVCPYNNRCMNDITVDEVDVQFKKMINELTSK